MNKARGVYSSEFKHECAVLVIEQGYGLLEACKAMNVSKSALSKWVKQVKAERVGISIKPTAITAEQQKIKELERRIKRMELENSILKKASALLMSDSLLNLS